jgi:hypothetical protein
MDELTPAPPAQLRYAAGQFEVGVLHTAQDGQRWIGVTDTGQDEPILQSRRSPPSVAGVCHWAARSPTAGACGAAAESAPRTR